MIDDAPINNGLLPAGFCDLLSPEAEKEAQGLHRMMEVFATYGYERVSPPLLEFEQSLLGHSGAGIAEQTFRLMDPKTHYMMGLRPDITPQIARIAATRLTNDPRPLRLSYAGSCVWVSESRPHATRQILQAGIELIGVDSPYADAEVIAVTADVLQALGVQSVSFDLTFPQIAQAIIDPAHFDKMQLKSLYRALDRKDVAGVKQYGGHLASVLIKMLQSAGPAERAIEILQQLDLPEVARQLRDRLLNSVLTIRELNPDLSLTIDPVEFRGWDYHTGMCVAVYVSGLNKEVGRGGRYLSNNNEPACGLTLRPDILLQAAQFPLSRSRVFVPSYSDLRKVEDLRKQGYVTIMGLQTVEDIQVEARRLKCGFIFNKGRLSSV